MTLGNTVTVTFDGDATSVLAAIDRCADRLHELASSDDLAQVVARTAELREALEDAEARLSRLATRAAAPPPPPGLGRPETQGGRGRPSPVTHLP